MRGLWPAFGRVRRAGGRMARKCTGTLLNGRTLCNGVGCLPVPRMPMPACKAGRVRRAHAGTCGAQAVDAQSGRALEGVRRQRLFRGPSSAAPSGSDSRHVMSPASPHASGGSSADTPEPRHGLPVGALGPHEDPCRRRESFRATTAGSRPAPSPGIWTPPRTLPCIMSNGWSDPPFPAQVLPDPKTFTWRGAPRRSSRARQCPDSGAGGGPQPPWRAAGARAPLGSSPQAALPFLACHGAFPHAFRPSTAPGSVHYHARLRRAAFPASCMPYQPMTQWAAWERRGALPGPPPVPAGAGLHAVYNRPRRQRARCPAPPYWRPARQDWPVTWPTRWGQI